MKKIVKLIMEILNKLSLKLVIRVLLGCLIVITASLIALTSMGNLHLLDLQHKDLIINVCLIISFLITALLMLFFNFTMKSIAKITKCAKQISDGKLNISDMEIESSDDLSELANAINNFKSNLLFLLAQTRSNIIVLSDSIERVSTSMDMVLAENEQVSSEMQEISSKSYEQLNIVTNTIAKTDEVKKSTDIINVNINKVEEIASGANLDAKTGNENLNIYNDNINSISKSMDSTYEFIGKLNVNVSEIRNVVSFIVGLSKQLKLLSLNASIQAEKAGEDGKSFAVVAQEITKLSDSTKEGIDTINLVITEILEGSSNVEDSLKQSIEYFESGKDVFLNIEKNFNEISEKNMLLLNEIRNVSLEASNINSNIHNTVSLCKDVNDSTLIVCQSTEEVAASMEEELGEFQGINSAMSELHLELTKIENLLTKFDLDIKPVKGIPAKPLKIVMIIPKFGYIWDVIQFGALYAKKLLSLKNTVVEVIPINSLSEDEYSDILKKCVKDGCNGIVTPGFMGNKLKEIEKMNIPIIIYNVDIKEKQRRIAYVGENAYESGIIAGKIMTEQIAGKEKILIITSEEEHESFKLRMQGFKDVICKNIEKVDILEVPPRDEEKIYSMVKEYLNRNSNINGILNVTGANLGLTRAIEEVRMSEKLKTIVFCPDLEKIIEYIKKGTITYAIAQDPFRQGYNGLIYMYNYLVNGEKPSEKETWTKVEVMDIKKAEHFLG